SLRQSRSDRNGKRGDGRGAQTAPGKKDRIEVSDQGVPGRYRRAAPGARASQLGQCVRVSQKTQRRPRPSVAPVVWRAAAPVTGPMTDSMRGARIAQKSISIPSLLLPEAELGATRATDR